AHEAVVDAVGEAARVEAVLPFAVAVVEGVHPCMMNDGRGSDVLTGSLGVSPIEILVASCNNCCSEPANQTGELFMGRFLGRRGLRSGLLIVAVLAVAGGIAYAAIPDSAGVYTACKLNATGTIRLIDPSL